MNGIKHLLMLAVIFSTIFISGCAMPATPSPLQGENTIAPQPSPTIMLATQTPTTQKDPRNSHAPEIEAIIFPAWIASNERYETGEVWFSDQDGDIYSAQFTLVAEGCMDLEYFAFNPMDFLGSGNQHEGVFRFLQSCRKCAGSAGDEIQMRVQLYDRDGNESAPADYSFICR